VALVTSVVSKLESSSDGVLNLAQHFSRDFLRVLPVGLALHGCFAWNVVLLVPGGLGRRFCLVCFRGRLPRRRLLCPANASFVAASVVVAAVGPGGGLVGRKSGPIGRLVILGTLSALVDCA